MKKLIQIGLYLDILSVTYFESLWSKHYMYYKAICSTDLNYTVDKCIILWSCDFPLFDFLFKEKLKVCVLCAVMIWHLFGML